MGSAKSIIDGIVNILGILTSGGPNSIIAILFINIVIMAFANYFTVKFIASFMRDHSVALNRVSEEKDKIMKDRVEKMESIVKQYNETQMETVDAIRKIETAVYTVKEIILALNNRRSPD